MGSQLPFERYFSCVSLTVLICVILFWGYVSFTPKLSDASPEQIEIAVRVFVWGILLSVFPGVLLWGPMVIVALIPGYFLFELLRHGLQKAFKCRILSVLLPTLVVCSLSVLLPFFIMQLEYGYRIAIRETKEAYFPLLFALPSATLSAFLILIPREKT